MPGSVMCLRLKQLMKAINEYIKIMAVGSLPITPRQPEGVCRKGTFY